MMNKNSFKKILTASLVVLSLTFALLGFTSIMRTPANAEEIPTVTDGSKIEMESVTPNGTPTYNNTSFIYDKDTASGGKAIGNWGNGNNNVTYKFKLEKAQKAKIGIALVTGWGGTQLITKVNGTSVPFETGFDSFNNDYHAFKVYYLKEVELVAGENSLYLEAYEGSNFNFDYITFKFSPEVHACEHVCKTCGLCTDFTCTDEVCAKKCEGHSQKGEHTHTFVNGVCSCGDIKIEVESVNPNGTPMDGNPTFIFDKATASGGKVIGNWGNGDTNVTYKFTAPKASWAKIGIALVTGWGSTSLITKVNGNSVSFVGSFDPFTDYNSGWYNFKTYYLQDVEIKEGENTIYLEADGGGRFNFDYILVEYFEKEAHVCKHVCETCGKCTDETCTDEVCKDKCLGHAPHACGHVCEICGLCTDFTCAKEACAKKCEGHSVDGDHTHTYVNGVCSCGNIKIEVESVKPNGTPTDGNPAFIFDKATASGGKVIGNWGKGDTNVTYKFTAKKAGWARIGIALVTGWTGTDLITKVNGEKVSFVGKFDPFTDWENGWYNFKTYYLQDVEVQEGENTIYLEACEGSNFNFDYILVNFIEKPAHVCKHVCETCGKCTDEACTDEVCKDKCLGHHVHAFKDGRCECGAYLLEAEDTDYNSTVESTDMSGAGVIVEETELASGGKVLGNWGKPGNKIVWSLEFGKATIAPIVLRMAPCSPAANFSNVIKLTVNDKVVALLNDSLPGLVGQGWYDFKDFETEPVEFSQGKVTIVMEMLQVYFVNVDCIVLGIPADVSVKVSEDAVKPEISEIKVVSTELVTGKEIEFSYTAKDNVTAEDKLVKVEKVYLNYNKEGQEEVACNSGKFTPAKAGRYTIVVTVTDEAGNTETGTRSLTVEESGTPVNPDSGNSGTGSNSGSSSSSGKKGSCIGSIDMGYVLFPIALALLSLVIIKKRKTGDR